jgi:hypothetical protein
MSIQPVWKRLWATDYSQLFIDETGVYAPELEYAQKIKEDDYSQDESTAMFEVYRVSCERYRIVTVDAVQYLVPFGYTESWTHPVTSYQPWFHDSLSAVASSSGLDEQELIGFLCSDNPGERANAYEAIYGHFGWYEGDQYPVTLTEAELNKRWG